MSDQELLTRLERLERENRRFKRVGIAVLVLVAIVTGLGAVQPIPSKIVAHEFDVVDGSGKVRVRLHTQANGNLAMIQVLDTAGVAQADMTDGPVMGPSIDLGFHKLDNGLPDAKVGWTPAVSIADSLLGPMISLNAPGVALGPGVGIGVTSKGQPNITLMDAKGTGRATISLFSSGEPEFEFVNESGRDTVRLTSLSNGASLEFLGSQDQKIGNNSFPVDRMELSTWGLSFDDENGAERARIYGSPVSGGPNIELSDVDGYSMELGSTSMIIPTTGQKQQTSATSIVMFGNDKDHHVIWKAP